MLACLSGVDTCGAATGSGTSCTGSARDYNGMYVISKQGKQRTALPLWESCGIRVWAD